MKIQLSEENLKDIISNFSLVIAPAATLSVLEAYIRNIRVVVYLDSEEINLTPLRKFSNVKIVSSVNEMNLALNPESLDIYRSSNQDLFWFDKNLALWNKIIN